MYTLQNYPHMLYIQALLEIVAQLPLINYSLILVNIAEETIQPHGNDNVHLKQVSFCDRLSMSNSPQPGPNIKLR